jgi:hypothetical protein
MASGGGDAYEGSILVAPGPLLYFCVCEMRKKFGSEGEALARIDRAYSLNMSALPCLSCGEQCAFLGHNAGNAEMRRDCAWRSLRGLDEHGRRRGKMGRRGARAVVRGEA